MESPAGFPNPVSVSAPRGVGRDGQKSNSGLESGDSGPDGVREFDRVWDQTVAGGSTSRGAVDPEGRDVLPSESPAEVVAPNGADTRPPVAGPIPSGEVVLPDDSTVAVPLEKSLIPPDTGLGLSPEPALRPEGPVDPAVSQANPSRPILPGPSARAQTAGPVVVDEAGVGNDVRMPGVPAQSPGRQDTVLPPPVSTDPLKPPAMPTEAQPPSPLRGGAAKFAGSGRPGSADPALSAESSRTEVNFLVDDHQQPMTSKGRTGISAALPGTHMRRPSEESSPPTMPSPVGSRLSSGSPVGSAVPVPTIVRQSGRVGVEADSIRAEPTAIDRIAAGSTVSEGSSVSSTPSGSSSVSLAGLRQADAASVLEMVNRMADQMAARSQDRLSMTVRLEDGASIRIRMTNDQGEIRTFFQTDLPGLEAALRQQWSQFSQDAHDRGLRFQSMTFASSDASPEKGDSQSGNSDRSETFLDDGAPSSPDSSFGAADQATQSTRREPAIASREPGRLRAWV